MLPVDLEKYKHEIVYTKLEMMFKHWNACLEALDEIHIALQDLNRRLQVLEKARCEYDASE